MLNPSHSIHTVGQVTIPSLPRAVITTQNSHPPIRRQPNHSIHISIALLRKMTSIFVRQGLNMLIIRAYAEVRSISCEVNRRKRARIPGPHMSSWITCIGLLIKGIVNELSLSQTQRWYAKLEKDFVDIEGRGYCGADGMRELRFLFGQKLQQADSRGILKRRIKRHNAKANHR
jgi:hypothetical protein